MREKPRELAEPMSGHTPGPWRVVEDRHTNAPVVLDKCSYTVARCLEPGEQRRANARLIAAAPELLEALKAVHERRIAWPAEIEGKVVSAITKAEGR